MPRTKSDRERGYIAAWMRRERTRLGWSPEQVVEALADDGTRIRPDYYRQLEAGTGGKKPGPELLAALVTLFRSEPEPFAEPPAPEPVPDLAALLASNEAVVAAVASQTEALERVWRSNDRQAQALEELAAAIRDSRAVTHDQATELTHSLAEAIGYAMRGLAIVPLPPGSPGSAEPSGSDAPPPDQGEPRASSRRGRGR